MSLPSVWTARGISLTPQLDRLIAKLRQPSDRSQVRATLAEFDTVLVHDMHHGVFGCMSRALVFCTKGGNR
jgi:hypothetical protein